MAFLEGDAKEGWGSASFLLRSTKIGGKPPMRLGRSLDRRLVCFKFAAFYLLLPFARGFREALSRRNLVQHTQV